MGGKDERLPKSVVAGDGRQTGTFPFEIKAVPLAGSRLGYHAALFSPPSWPGEVKVCWNLRRRDRGGADIAQKAIWGYGCERYAAIISKIA